MDTVLALFHKSKSDFITSYSTSQIPINALTIGLLYSCHHNDIQNAISFFSSLLLVASNPLDNNSNSPILLKLFNELAALTGSSPIFEPSLCEIFEKSGEILYKTQFNSNLYKSTSVSFSECYRNLTKPFATNDHMLGLYRTARLNKEFMDFRCDLFEEDVAEGLERLGRRKDEDLSEFARDLRQFYSVLRRKERKYIGDLVEYAGWRIKKVISGKLGKECREMIEATYEFFEIFNENLRLEIEMMLGTSKCFNSIKSARPVEPAAKTQELLIKARAKPYDAAEEVKTLPRKLIRPKELPASSHNPIMQIQESNKPQERAVYLQDIEAKILEPYIKPQDTESTSMKPRSIRIIEKPYSEDEVEEPKPAKSENQSSFFDDASHKMPLFYEKANPSKPQSHKAAKFSIKESPGYNETPISSPEKPEESQKRVDSTEYEVKSNIKAILLKYKSKWKGNYISNSLSLIEELKALKIFSENFGEIFYMEALELMKTDDVEKNKHFWKTVAKCSMDFIDAHKVDAIRRRISQGNKEEYKHPEENRPDKPVYSGKYKKKAQAVNIKEVEDTTEKSIH